VGRLKILKGLTLSQGRLILYNTHVENKVLNSGGSKMAQLQVGDLITVGLVRDPEEGEVLVCTKVLAVWEEGERVIGWVKVNFNTDKDGPREDWLVRFWEVSSDDETWYAGVWLDRFDLLRDFFKNL
jgi:hypothetical protein